MSTFAPGERVVIDGTLIATYVKALPEDRIAIDTGFGIINVENYRVRSEA